MNCFGIEVNMDACRGCDGKKIRSKIDGWKVIETVCSRCNGSGSEPVVSKSKRRFFRKKIDDVDPENMTMEQQTQKFLRAHGY